MVGEDIRAAPEASSNITLRPGNDWRQNGRNMIRKDAKNMGYHEGKKNRRQGLCRGGWDCYDRMYVHRGTVIQLKQEVSEITDFVMAVGEIHLQHRV